MTDFRALRFVCASACLALLLGPPLAASAAAASPDAAAGCTVPGHRTVPAGSRVVFSFSGISPSFQQAFRAADNSVAGIVATGARPYPVRVFACHIARPGTHGITGAKSNGARICIDDAYAGKAWTNGSSTTDAQGDTFAPLELAWHEFGHAVGLQHPRCKLPPSVSDMNPEMSDNGAPGRYGSGDLATLHRVYGR